MRILFDENLPLPLRQYFVGDDVSTVQQEGWSGIGNGELVRRAEGRFDVLILADKNLRYQQNVSQRTIAFVELPTNRWPVLKAMATRIVAAARSAKAGSYVALDP